MAPHLSQDAVSQLFDAAPLPMVLCAFPGGEVRRANRRAEELFIIGRDIDSCSLDDIVGAELREKFLLHLRDSGGFVDDFEVTLRTAYGESIAGTLSGQMITIDEDRFIVIGMNDITDRKVAEETLRRFFEAGPLAMLLFNLRSHKVTRINRRASELFAVASDGGLVTNAQTLDDFLGADAARHFSRLLGEGGFVDSFEARLNTDYGESFWALISGQVVEVQHERSVLVGVTDITDRKRAEEEVNAARDVAEDAVQAKSLFLATMSHEIRTPMNGVLGMLEILGRSRLTAEQREMVDVIGQSASSLLTIIDDILDLSKIEAGKLTLERIPLHLRSIVEIAVELVAPQARGKGIEVAWWTDGSLPDHFLADPVRLRQILLNLLTNAIKFTEHGSITVSVHAMGWRDDGDLDVRFAVTDSGIGLTPEQRDRLFTPFVQADISTTRQFGGTGLGLSICRKLTEMMGGEIGVSSTVGVGSSFWFELPLTVAAQPQEPPLQDLLGLHILVVDDLPEARASIAAVLRQRGANVSEASDVASANDHLADQIDFDLAIVDLTDCLPDLLEPLTHRIGRDRILPIVPVYYDQETAFCREEGLLAPLLKPIRASALARAVNTALHRTEFLDSDRPLPGPAVSSAPRLSPEAALAAGRLILVAEDNAVNRLVIARQLTELGHVFDIGNDGEAAWDLLCAKRYGLVLTDCAMPKLDGYQLTQRIRAREAETGEPRMTVVALTANVMEGEQEKCRAAGLDGYLSKPVVLDQLAACLDRWLPPLPPLPPSAEIPHATADIAPPPLVREAGSEGLIDLAQFGQIIGTDDPAVIGEMLDFFVETFDMTFASVIAAHQSGDRDRLHVAAHTAKGAARSACVMQLAGILEELEQKALTDEGFPQLQQRIVAAQLAFAAVRARIAEGFG